jgi:hypothetical protein
MAAGSAADVPDGEDAAAQDPTAQDPTAQDPAADAGGPGYFDLPSTESAPEQTTGRRRFGRRGDRT